MGDEPELAALYEMSLYAAETIHRSDPKEKREWDETIVTREGVRDACWYFGVKKPKHRRRARAWVSLAVASMNEGRTFVSRLDEEEMARAREDAERRAREYALREKERALKRKAREIRERRRSAGG